jgi:hypothetical protein
MRTPLRIATIFAGAAMTVMGLTALWLQYLAPVFASAR